MASIFSEGIGDQFVVSMYSWKNLYSNFLLDIFLIKI